MDYIFAYGSLLSHYSRTHYSGITTKPVSATVRGWSRSWCAAYPDEGATYAGAIVDDTAELDGILIETEIDQGLIEREREYRFSELRQDTLNYDRRELRLSSSDRIYICETIAPKLPSQQLPLPQSYIDTCLIGCYELNGADGMARFIDQTTAWECVWLNDRGSHIYPRSSPISSFHVEQIDSILENRGVLKNRAAAT